MFATLRVTAGCNLDCPQCYSKGAPCKKDMTLPEMKKAIIKLKENGITHLTISGGEPFTRPDILEILEFSSRKIRTGIVTNGTLLTEEIIQRLKDIPLNNIMISLDAPPGIHEKIRIGAEDTVKSINACLESGLPIGISTTLTSLNKHLIKEIYAYIREKNIRRWIIETIKPVGSAKKSAITIPQKEKSKILEYLRSIQKEDNYTKISIFDCETRCRAGNNMLSVNPDGTVTPCAFMPATVCGSILDDDFTDILEKIHEITGKGITCFRN